MALDVYVGCFSRYFAREWENVAQKMAREMRYEYHLISAGGPIEIASWEDLTEATITWRDGLNEGLANNLERPLHWEETREAPYFTDRPGYDCYGALNLWAAYAEAGLSPPDFYAENWYDDSVYREYASPQRSMRFGPLLSASLWLPGDFHFSFEYPDLTGKLVRVTSNSALWGTIQKLNASGLPSTTTGDAAPLEVSESPARLSALAQQGASIFRELCAKSLEHRLPILLDM